jgi:Protein of unknown function (DUF2550)
VGGALALDAAWLFAAFLIILILAAVGIAARRFLLERGGGTVECGLRCGPNGSWRLGVASYQREELNWFGALGLTMRPDVVFPRRDLTVVSRRLPTDAEAASLGPGMIVVECQLGEDSGQFSLAPDGAPGPGPGGALGPLGGPGPGGIIELAMGEEALTGLLAWLEAAPPGSHLGVAL